jgi:hypothetical protein
MAAAATFAFRTTSSAKIEMCRKLIRFVPFMESRSNTRNISWKVSEVPKTSSEKSNMTTAEFVQFALQDHVAPKSLGAVKTRLPHAQRTMQRRGWSANRVRELWYLDPRASEPKWREIHDIEEITGLTYARQELRTNDQLISQADALLEGVHADFYGPLVAALRAFTRALHSPRTGGGADK